jgi:hypothetical protein
MDTPLAEFFFIYTSSIVLYAYVHIGAEMWRDWQRS